MNRETLFNFVKYPLNGREDSESDMYEIADKLLKNKSITINERLEFNTTRKFRDVMDYCAEKLDVRYDNREETQFIAKLPEIMFKIYQKAPNFFNNAGAYLYPHVYVHPVSDVKEKEISLQEQRKLIEVKKAFNLQLDERIEKSIYFGQISKDFDILGKSEEIDEKLRSDYQQIGNSRISSIGKAIRENNSDIDIFMRVFEKDGQVSAPGPAYRLLKAGADVYNYEEGEKIGVIISAELKSDWNKKLYKVIENAEDFVNKSLSTLSKETGIKKRDLKKFKSGKKIPKFRQVKALETFVNEQTGALTNGLNISEIFREKDSVFTIFRELPRGGVSNYVATEPQTHRLFGALVIDYYPPASLNFQTYMHRKTRENPKITIEDLEKWLPK